MLAAVITLRYQGKDVVFEKSDRLVAVWARAGMVDAMHDDIERIAPGNGRTRAALADAFEVVDLGASGDAINRNLDWLRSRAAVAAATHVFRMGAAGIGYVPTGKIHLVFESGVKGHEQQAMLSQYRLQAVETRGAGDFLVSITSGSKNPIATAAALQQEPGVAVAEPEIAAPA
jgi:hypothetical protein